MAEMLVQYADGATFVEVLVDENRYERRDVELGLSDGISVEVLGVFPQTINSRSGTNRSTNLTSPLPSARCGA